MRIDPMSDRSQAKKLPREFRKAKAASPCSRSYTLVDSPGSRMVFLGTIWILQVPCSIMITAQNGFGEISEKQNKQAFHPLVRSDLPDYAVWCFSNNRQEIDRNLWPLSSRWIWSRTWPG